MLVPCLLLALLHLSSGAKLPATRTTDYDMLIFTQAWPPTSCYVWEEGGPARHCNLPPNEEWSIHGLWPTKNGTLGPFYCNHSLHFDLSVLAPIRSELEVKWIDVHKGSKPHEFWRHEWEKHGTCSVDIASLDSEINYFRKGLELFDEYDMKNVLGKATIVPNEKYTVKTYLEGLKKILGKNAMVECAKDKKADVYYVSELRICFDKQLELMDCDGAAQFPSNCKHNELIAYPGSVPDLIMQPQVIQV